MARYFTRDEAERLLPEIGKRIEEALLLKTSAQVAEKEMREFSDRILLMGGTRVRHTRILETRARRDASAERLRQVVEEIQERGCVVKDVDIGLVDFPALYRGQEVYLCWKLGEPHIAFWHGVTEGFRGRKPIDDDFLAHHQGTSPA